MTMIMAPAGWSQKSLAKTSYPLRLPGWDGVLTEIALDGPRALYSARTVPLPPEWQHNQGFPGNEIRLFDLLHQRWTVVAHLSSAARRQGYGYQNLRLHDDWAVYEASLFAAIGPWCLWLVNLRTGRQELLDSAEREHGMSRLPAVDLDARSGVAWDAQRYLPGSAVAYSTPILFHDLRTDRTTVLRDSAPILPGSRQKTVTYHLGGPARSLWKTTLVCEEDSGNYADIALIDVHTKRLRPVTHHSADQWPVIWDDTLVWVSSPTLNYEGAIVLVSLRTGQRQILDTYGYNPLVGDGYVTWQSVSHAGPADLGSTPLYDVARRRFVSGASLVGAAQPAVIGIYPFGKQLLLWRQNTSSGARSLPLPAVSTQAITLP